MHGVVSLSDLLYLPIGLSRKPEFIANNYTFPISVSTMGGEAWE